jgi:hypothetical protein
MRFLIRHAALGAALITTMSVLALLAPPAASAAGGPTLTDITHTPPAGDTIALTPGGGGQDTWYDCDSASPAITLVGCTQVSTGGLSYRVTGADQTRYANNFIVVFEGGLLGLLSSPSNAIQVGPAASGPAPPSNVVAPTATGATTVGSTLTAVTGVWVGATSYSYTWSRCESNGTNCTQVATGGSYTLTGADLGSKILLTQRAAGPGGTATAHSPLYGPVTTAAGSVPAPDPGTAKPGLTGVPQIGATVTASPVPMSNNPAYAYQWMRCSANCTAIPGATTTAYAPTASDLGDTLVFVETGANAGGAAQVRSPQSVPVTAPTETTLQVSPHKVVAGQPETLVATVTSATGAAPPTGSVTFERSGVPARGCKSVNTKPSGVSATVVCRTRFAAGRAGLVAAFTPTSGALVTGSNSTVDGFVVGRDPTTVQLIMARRLTVNRRHTLMARVRPAPGTKRFAPTGTVVFLDRGKVIRGCVEAVTDGVVRCSVRYHRLRAHAISAIYLGDDTFSGSSSRIHETRVTVAKPSGYVTALMAWTFRYSPSSTQVALLRVTGLVRGVSVSLACSGHGCPLHHHVYRMTKRSCHNAGGGKRHSCQPLDLAARLHHARLGVGAKLTVRLTHRGWLGKYYRFVIRPGRKPKIVTACLAVGVRKPNFACTPR